MWLDLGAQAVSPESPSLWSHLSSSWLPSQTNHLCWWHLYGKPSHKNDGYTFPLWQEKPQIEFHGGLALSSNESGRQSQDLACELSCLVFTYKEKWVLSHMSPLEHSKLCHIQHPFHKAQTSRFFSRLVCCQAIFLSFPPPVILFMWIKDCDFKNSKKAKQK